MLALEAHAKVNLTLEVLGRREDEYHDIASVIQTIDLCDTLTLESADNMTLECDSSGLAAADNIALKAAVLLKEHSGTRDGVHIRLSKNIPLSSGLGGGSSDAAAVLVGLNRLWSLGLPIQDLLPIATRLGSDVPFFLHGGTAMVLGRGERVRVLPPADLQWMVVLIPGIKLPHKTASAYAMLDDGKFTRGFLTRKLEARIRGGGDVPPQFLFNVFDAVAFDAFPGLKKYWSAFHSLGARELHLAGSGPSVFAPVSRRELGTALQLLLSRRYGWEVYLASTWWPPSKGET